MILPHGVPPQRPSLYTTFYNNSNGRPPHHSSRLSTYFLMLAVAVPSFFLGTLLSLYAGVDCRGAASGIFGNHLTDILVENRVQERVIDIQQQLEAKVQEQVDAQVNLRLAAAAAAQGGGGVVNCDGSLNNINNNSSGPKLFPEQDFGKFLTHMARVSKEDFVRHIDPGVPLDEPKEGVQDVLLLYSHKGSVPTVYKESSSLDYGNPRLSMPQAVENCEQLNLILAYNGGDRKQCFAIMPQYESFHIQKWMRLPKNRKLHLVSRGQTDKGVDRFRPPRKYETVQHWTWLQSYLNNMHDVLAELEPILKKIAHDNTVIVLVCNFGQSELLMNFVCSSRARGFDLKNAILFATDVETKELAESLGLTTYYDYRNFANTPVEAARVYGDRQFVAMMFAKVVCVQLVSALGYNFLFQDVDIVWYQNPLTYFDQSSLKKNYDVVFQDDGGHSLRYAPYSANSGFYFVYANDRTRHFMNSMLMAGALIISTKSHQQALIALLQEHVSLHGLRAKILSRDMEEFPGGYQFHQKTGKYMKALFAGKVHPIIFHMSWTTNKNNKLLFFQQMGEWWVNEQCVGKKRQDILGVFNAWSNDLKPTCCAPEPLISCHYRDKPSKFPCKDSPNIDKNRKSFW